MPSTLLLRSGTAEITRAAETELANLLGTTKSAAAAREQLQVILPALMDYYGPAAGTFAADWYDETRFENGIDGQFRSSLADLPDLARTESLARWAVEPLAKNPDDFATVLTKAQGGLQRIVANAGRDTIAGSSVRDPRAKGWHRVGSGHSCEFCIMLIGRGEVYREATAFFDAHDHCNCSAEPAWS